MPETNPGSKELPPSPAELAEKIGKLEAQLSEQSKVIEELREKNNVQAKALTEIASRTNAEPALMNKRQATANNKRVRPVYNSGAKGYGEGMKQYMDRTATWREMGNRMRQAGMTDDTAPAHEEEFYGSQTPEVTSPPDPTEVNPEAPRITELQAEVDTNLGKLDSVILAFAKARVERERMFSGGKANAEINTQSEELNRVFGEWANSFSSLIDEKYRETIDEGKQIADYLVGWQTEMTRLENIPEDERPADFDRQVQTAEEALRFLENRKSTLDQFFDELKQYRNKVINEQLMKIRKRVDDVMVEERENNHKNLGKVANWLRKNKGARIAAGVALTGIGIFAAAHANAPLLSLTIAGGAALRGFGGYNAVRGTGDFLADRGADKADISANMDDVDAYDKYAENYTKSAKKQSGKKHRWNRGAAAAGVGLAAVPVIGKALQATEAAPAPPPAGPKMSPENQEAFARYLGATSKNTEGAANFNRMFGGTAEQVADLRGGSISLEHLTSPQWLEQAGITSDAAKNQFNFLLGQASTSPEATQAFIDNLPNTLNQLGGA